MPYTPSPSKAAAPVETIAAPGVSGKLHAFVLTCGGRPSGTRAS
jgi:hypothetical protein